MCANCARCRVFRSIFRFAISGTDGFDYVGNGHILKGDWWRGNNVMNGIAYTVHYGPFQLLLGVHPVVTNFVPGTCHGDLCCGHIFAHFSRQGVRIVPRLQRVRRQCWCLKRACPIGAGSELGLRALVREGCALLWQRHLGCSTPKV